MATTTPRQQKYDQQALAALKSRLPEGATISGSVVSLPVPAGTPVSSLAVGSIRVSKGRDQMISPEIQWDSVTGYCRSHHLALCRVYLDMHKSGRTFEKRAVAEIVQGVKDHQFSSVVLWKWSRWGRNVTWSGVYLHSVEQAGGSVRSSTEDLDPRTAVGRFTRTQLLAIAEFESDVKSEGWKETHEHRRKDGLPHSGAPRFGYTYTRTGYLPDPDTGDIVADAYERFVAGTSMRSLSLEWQARGLVTKAGGVWTAQALGRMLDTGFGAGLIRERSKPPTAATNKRTLREFDIWRKGAHKALIEMDLWEQYKAKRMTNADLPTRVIRATHTLSGLAYCGICYRDLNIEKRMQSAYSGSHNKHTWVCKNAVDVKMHVACSGSNARVEAVVKEWLALQAEGGEDVAQRAEKESAHQRSVTQVDVLRKEIDRLTRKRKRLADGWTDGLIDDDDYKGQITEIRETLASAQQQLGQAEESAQSVDVSFAPLAANLLAAWDAMSPELRREALSKVVSKVLIFPGKWSETPDKVEIVPRWAA